MYERPGEFSAAETRGIGSFPRNKVVGDSQGRGWRDVHATLAAVDDWSGVHLPHAHNCIAYCVSQPAYLRCRIDGRDTSLTLKPRQFFVIPGRRESEWHRRGRSEMLMIYLRQDLLDGLAGQISSLGVASRGSADIELPLGATDGMLEQFALSILSILRHPEDGSSALYIDSLGRAAAFHLLRGGASARPRHACEAVSPQHIATSRLRRVVDYIEAYVGGDLSLSVLARQAGLPDRSLAQTFRMVYGTSPHQYVLSRRLDRAKVLLASTDLPIADVAFETGFSSQSHLTTAFGRLAGVTPAEYRRHGEGA